MVAVDTSTVERLPGGPSPPTGPRQLRHRRRFWNRRRLIIAVVAFLAGMALVLVPYSLRGQPGAKSLAAAMKALGAGGVAGGSAPSSSGLHYRYPDPGVYELTGEGSEHISFPHNSQHDSKVMPGSISILDDGCWRWRVDYNVAHWEFYDFCPTAGALVLQGNDNSQTWSFGLFKISNLARFTCPAHTVWLPASPTPGPQPAYSCSGANSAVAGATTATTTIRVAGVVSLTIGGQPVRVVEEEDNTVLSGGQKGTVAETWWLDLQNGMPVRMQRSMSIATASPLGNIDYTESGHWQMAYLVPQIG
ncbi:MAG TPA: hypothetical protein VK428_03515 [Acidimicrobiales bacterium]|nr:hypothetical protein [Acidimicrobiales bacterium]